MSWSDAEDAQACGQKFQEKGDDGRDQCRDAARRRRADLRASMRVWLLSSAVSLLLMLEDDVAMIALMFC